GLSLTETGKNRKPLTQKSVRGPVAIRSRQPNTSETRSRPCQPNTSEKRSAGANPDVEAGDDLRVQPDADAVGADTLDRVVDHDAAPVELRTTGGLDRLGDVARGDRAEQPARLARARLEPDLEPAELVGDLLGRAQVTDLAS